MFKKFSILISTKNRLADLIFTLEKIKHLIDRDDVECVVFDDGSSDGTTNYIARNYPEIILHSNKVSKGYLYCRNKMLNETKAEFSISLDDDAHFITLEPLEIISDFFLQNPKAALLGFRVFWSKETPENIFSNDLPVRMKSFVGCGHVWRMQVWREIPNYPEWFVFYGEENFASYQLFKRKWEIHYLPNVLVNHRVSLKERKKASDYCLRLRSSLRSGWYLYFLFLPLSLVPKTLASSIWAQLKLKVFKGDWDALKSISLAMKDLLLSFPKIIKNTNRLTKAEYKLYQELAEAKLYWKPEDEIQQNKIDCR